MLKLGSHVGMSGKKMMLGSVEEALSYGANTFMIYTGAPQNTKRKDLSELNIEAARKCMAENGIEEFIVHAPYIINLGNTIKPETYEIAVEFLALELQRTMAMGSKVLVLHPGAHVGAGVEAGVASIVKGINEVLTAAVTAMFRKDVSFKRRKLSFSDQDTERIYRQLKQRGCLYEMDGKLSKIRFLPVGNTMGYLSQNEENARLKVNASFFLFDRLDCASVYDRIGTAFGLCVKDGKILLPSMLDREVLMVDKEGRVSVSHIPLKQIVTEIDGTRYQDGINCRFYSRPQREKTTAGICDIIVEGNHVVGIRKGGKTLIPCGGFVIQTNQMIEKINDTKVKFHGLEDILFAVQVGNSVIVNGNKTKRFISPFYRFPNPHETVYPPAMYPLNYKKDRAPRIVLGADKDNRPVLVWLEGAGKFGHVKGEGSCGASMSETADICEELSLHNAIHLDGGGSAQILINNQKQLKISDRDPNDFSEKERAVAMGLCIR